MDMTKMGTFLQTLRKEQGLTQEQLGEKLHVSSKTISRWETGTYMVPVEMLLALSELYQVSMNELVLGERIVPEVLPAKAEEAVTDAEPVSVDYIASLEERFRSVTGRRCKITDTKNKKTFQIEYRDNEDLEQILRSLAGDDLLDQF